MEIKPHRDHTRSFYLEAPGGHSIEIICVEGTQWENLQTAAEQPDTDTFAPEGMN